MTTAADLAALTRAVAADLTNPGSVARTFIRLRERAVSDGSLVYCAPAKPPAKEWRALKRNLLNLHLAVEGEWCPGAAGEGHPHPAQGPWTLDHVVPRSLGGTNAAANLDVVCGPCNNRRMPWALWWFVAAEDFGAHGVAAEADRLRRIHRLGAAVLEPARLEALQGAYDEADNWALVG